MHGYRCKVVRFCVHASPPRHLQVQVCSRLLSPLQVHYSTHLAVTQVLMRRQQQHQRRKESNQLALFGNLLKDRNGNLCSPYAPSILDM
ncbi:hypothetical protein AALO_G00265110 [Alosa alosa]|uniref:Uncharacterized protein n=1 Tax=Alosa alosa TaxID=278164 RepID=A0AAV6FKN7_9TELE|nr:hypothetical protein AALO_G00265110 [Alosa alosa]